MISIPSNILINYPKVSFSGHETFPFRYSWLPKGVQQVSNHENLFVRDDAVVILGVGKNMVKSINHWVKILGLVYSPERGKYKPTILGKKIFSENGWDPYLEDPTTLWLLHWQLASRIETATTWFLAFSAWNSIEFTRQNLENWIFKIMSNNSSSRVTTSSLHRDMDVFLRTYVRMESKRNKLIEDSFDCPLVELGIIEEIEKSGIYRFLRGPKPSLPNFLFLYSLVDYWDQNFDEQNTLSYEKILHNPGSPGTVFKLSENSIIEYLEQLPSWSGFIYDDTSGMRTIFRQSRSISKLDILNRYYLMQRGKE